MYLVDVGCPELFHCNCSLIATKGLSCPKLRVYGVERFHCVYKVACYNPHTKGDNFILNALKPHVHEYVHQSLCTTDPGCIQVSSWMEGCTKEASPTRSLTAIPVRGSQRGSCGGRQNIFLPRHTYKQGCTAIEILSIGVHVRIHSW